MIKKYSGTYTSRFTSGLDYRATIDVVEPEKALLRILPKRSGRDNSGQISSRHHGGRNKRFYRLVDFKRDKENMAAKVVTIEYDPNRNANLALVIFADGEKRYILAPSGLTRGEIVTSGKAAEIKLGNCLPLSGIPIGTIVHNIELQAGRGGILARGAGGGAKILSKEEGYATIKLPSGETRRIPQACHATIGVVGNIDVKNLVLGTAGRARHIGRRPKVRGVAQNPRTHPHGGGEGRSGVGLKQPKTPWGKPARGLRTRNKRKYSSQFIVERRNK